MADEFTLTTSGVRIATWDAPRSVEANNFVPRGEVIFDGSVVLPASGGGTHMWALTCPFPRNFVYRISEIFFWASATAANVFTQFEDGMTLQVTTDQADQSPYLIYLANAVLDASAGAGSATDGHSFIRQGTSLGDAFITFFRPDQGIPPSLINAGKGGAQLLTYWYLGNNPTAAKANWRIRAAMYDVDQQDKWQINAPYPVQSI